MHAAREVSEMSRGGHERGEWMTEGTRKALVYARVSTDEQARIGYSLRQQIEVLREWCAREGYEVLEEVTDPGQSGATLQRPGMDRVRDLVAGGGVSVVLAQDADRITRDPIHRGFLDDEFERFGTRLAALDDWGDDSHEGELLKYVRGWMSKGERLKIAERTRRGLDRKVREGKVIRGNKAPYGFAYAEDGNSLVIAPEMAVVRRIFQMVGAEGLSLGEAERQLNREGIPSPTGGKWRRQSVRYLILSELYRPLSTGDVAASGLVTPEVVHTLDEEGIFGLWSWNKFQVKRWRESAEDGDTSTASRTRNARGRSGRRSPCPSRTRDS
jgi:site-specific DNA recombinase